MRVTLTWLAFLGMALVVCAEAPPAPAVSSSSNAFTPDIAVIGDFLAAAGGADEAASPSSFELHEVEASFQSVVDPFARADFFFAFSPDDVEVEEAFVTFTALPAALLLKAGKLRAAFGKVNTMHNHVLPWADRPIVTRNLLGGEEGISDAGLNLSRLFPSEHVFLEATAEVYRGESALFRARRRQDLAYGGRIRAYRDLGEAANLDVGTSVASGPNEDALRTRLVGVDVTFRYRPLRRALYRGLLARAELVWSRRQAAQAVHRAFGMYAAVEYQFARRALVGLRWDRSARLVEPSFVDEGASALVTYRPSEFSHVRVQYRRTKPGAGPRVNELIFQLLFAIGAHGSHPF